MLKQPYASTQLVNLLDLLLDPLDRAWLKGKLATRQMQRLHQLNTDLLGLALLVQARRASSGY